MNSKKSIINIIAVVVSVAAVVTAIIVFRKQILEAFTKAKNCIQDKFNKISKPVEYDDFADV